MTITSVAGARGSRARISLALRVALVTAAALGMSHRSSAQTAGPGATRSDTGLTLRDVVTVTLRSNADLLTAVAGAEQSRGALLSARGQFDTQMATSMGNGRDNSFVATGAPTTPFAPLTTSSVSYSVALQKQFRSGIVVVPQVDVQRSGYSTAPGIFTGQATTHLKTIVPLWKDRGGSVTVATERAAEQTFDGAELTARYAAARSVLSAVSAYWSYRAAFRRLDVLTASEQRADRLVEETQRLVGAEERTSADVKQLRANLAAKRVARITAEQDVIEARQQVGLVMGVAPDSIAVLPRAATEFPAAPADALASDAVIVWRRTAYAERADYAAAAAAVRAAEWGRRAAHGDLQPRIDATIDLGYAGLDYGLGGRLFSPLYRNVVGLNSSVRISYQLPVTNVGAQGRALEADAVYTQQRLALSQAERRVASDVAVAAGAVQHGRLELIASREAVELWTASVENEQRRFRLGAGTIFDIIQAQDALTNTQLAEIASARAYAQSLATLSFATGTLVRRIDGALAVAWTDLLAVP